MLGCFERLCEALAATVKICQALALEASGVLWEALGLFSESLSWECLVFSGVC